MHRRPVPGSTAPTLRAQEEEKVSLVWLDHVNIRTARLEEMRQAA